MKVVLFNGPPRSGKDTVARMLADKLDKVGVMTPVREVSLSTPLREIAYATSQYDGRLDGRDYEFFKEMVFHELGGIDGRHLMISISEDWLKVKFGQRVMADMLMVRQNIQMFDGVMLVRDCGFQVEINPLIERYGEANVYLVNVHRDGCDFSNDSREWVNHPKSANQMQLWNNGTLDDLRTEAGRIYGRLVNQMGWVL